MIKTALLNVTQIEPRFKHPTIFDHFDSLDEGEAFEILNDHDPKPLYYQLLGERGNYFTWEYLENGPQWWRVKIAKPEATKNKEETVGVLAAKDSRKADVFKKLGIDFCCGGKKTIKQAADEIGLSEIQLREQLNQVEQKTKGPAVHDFDQWKLSFLSDYIYNVHHQYIRENGPIIIELADKVAMRHGIEHPELLSLAKGMKELIDDLYDHIVTEENVLFPLVKQLESNTSVDPSVCKEAIAHLEQEHEHAGDELRHFRTLTRNYHLPVNACNSYTYLFDKIKEFEEDLFQHIHLENNILFPKAMALG